LLVGMILGFPQRNPITIKFLYPNIGNLDIFNS